MTICFVPRFLVRQLSRSPQDDVGVLVLVPHLALARGRGLFEPTRRLRTVFRVVIRREMLRGAGRARGHGAGR